jgi:glycosyltransferase involved in cell wall biosynthesis
MAADMSDPDKTYAMSPGELADSSEKTMPAVLFVRCGPPAEMSVQAVESTLADGLSSENWTTALYQPPARTSRANYSAPWGRFCDRLSAKTEYLRSLMRLIPKFDIVHVGVTAPPGMASRYIARQALPALVLARFFGKKTVLQLASAEIETFLEKQGIWYHPILRTADSIVVSSRYLQKVVERFHLSARRVMAPYGLKGIEHRVIRNLQPRILVNCPLEAQYNVACAIKAFRLVKQKYPRAELIVVGDGDTRPDLDALITDHNIWGVEFLGRLTSEQTRIQYRDSDLLLHTPSVDESPAAVVMAFAAGLPVVATDADGVLHMMRDRQSAMVSAVGDHVGLADRIIELIEDPALTEKLSINGRFEAQKYTWSRVRQDWVNLYSNLTA